MSVRRDIELGLAMDTNESLGRNVIAVIGIDRYVHWPRLDNAASDARGAAALFARLGFEQITEPLLDERATGKAAQELVNDDLAVLGSNDSLVVFYAGHGSTRTNQVGNQMVKTGYLIPVDASDRWASWIELAGWLRALSILPAKHILVILDACHSGIALGPIIKWRDSGTWRDAPTSVLRSRRSRRIITSALDDQTALDSGPLYGHSLFTGCMITGLTHGIARANRREISGSELALYLRERVEKYPSSRQTPDFGTFDFDERGELMIPLAVDPEQDASGVGFGPADPSGPEIEPSDTLVSLPGMAPMADHANRVPAKAGGADAASNPTHGRTSGVVTGVIEVRPPTSVVDIFPAGDTPVRVEPIPAALVSASASADDVPRRVTRSLAPKTLLRAASSTHPEVEHRLWLAWMQLRNWVRWLRKSPITGAIILVVCLAPAVVPLTLAYLDGAPTARRHTPVPGSASRSRSSPEDPWQSTTAGTSIRDGGTMPEQMDVSEAKNTLLALLKERTDAGCRVVQAPKEYQGDISASIKSPGEYCIADIYVSADPTERLQLTFTSPLGETLTVPAPDATVELIHCPRVVGEYAIAVRRATNAPFVAAMLECNGSTMAEHGPRKAAAEAARDVLAARVRSRLGAGCTVARSGAPQPTMGKEQWTTTVHALGYCIEHLFESSALDNPVAVTVTNPVGQDLPMSKPAKSFTVRYCPARIGEYKREVRPKNDQPYAMATLECPRPARESRR